MLPSTSSFTDTFKGYQIFTSTKFHAATVLIFSRWLHANRGIMKHYRRHFRLLLGTDTIRPNPKVGVQSERKQVSDSIFKF